MRCESSVFTAQWDLSFYFIWPDFGLSRITSAVSDVLANFSRLSTFVSHVNLFYKFGEIFSFSQPTRKVTRPHSAKYQNIMTPKRARSTQLLGESQINCSGLGLDCWLAFRLSTASNAWTALRHPFTAAFYCQGQGEKQCFLATHLEYRAFHFRASPTDIVATFREYQPGSALCNPWPVDNRVFL